MSVSKSGLPTVRHCFTRCLVYNVSGRSQTVQAVCTCYLVYVLAAGELLCRSQASPLPCLSLLYEELPCRASACPLLRTFSLSWLRKNSAYSDKIIQIWSFARRGAKRELVCARSVAWRGVFCRRCRFSRWLSQPGGAGLSPDKTDYTYFVVLI
jgi:hypothetical protein